MYDGPCATFLNRDFESRVLTGFPHKIIYLPDFCVVVLAVDVSEGLGKSSNTDFIHSISTSKFAVIRKNIADELRALYRNRMRIGSTLQRRTLSQKSSNHFLICLR